MIHGARIAAISAALMTVFVVSCSMKSPDRKLVEAAARRLLVASGPDDAQAFACAPVVPADVYGAVLTDKRFSDCWPEKVFVTFEAVFNEPGVPIANINCKDGRRLDVILHEIDPVRCPSTNTTGFVVSSIQLVSTNPKQILFMLPPSADTALPERPSREGGKGGNGDIVLFLTD